MGCFNSKTVGSGKHAPKMNPSMRIVGSHHEHHLHLKKAEKASQVHVTAGVHQLKKVYDIDRHVLGKGAFGKVYKGVDR